MGPSRYRIVLRGRLSERFETAFEGMALEPGPNQTVLVGEVRDQDGLTAIIAGDAFLFRPDEPHQISNNGNQDLVILVIADNPIGESAYYPDSKKWLVRSPQRTIIRPQNPYGEDYFLGEE